MLDALALRLGWWSLAVGIHRLGRGLPGYLILFAPHALARSVSKEDDELLSPFGSHPNINEFHLYTWSSVQLPSILA